jgi:hypothetical protein
MGRPHSDMGMTEVRAAIAGQKLQHTGYRWALGRRNEALWQDVGSVEPSEAALQDSDARQTGAVRQLINRRKRVEALITDREKQVTQLLSNSQSIAARHRENSFPTQ